MKGEFHVFCSKFPMFLQPIHLACSYPSALPVVDTQFQPNEATGLSLNKAVLQILSFSSFAKIPSFWKSQYLMLLSPKQTLRALTACTVWFCLCPGYIVPFIKICMCVLLHLKVCKFTFFASVTAWSSYFFSLKKFLGLSSWLSGKESICQCRRHRFDPRSGKIPHASKQLNPCATTTEPVL